MTTKDEKKKKEAELRKKAQEKNKTSPKDVQVQLATRDLLERDYEEDTIYVKFKSSSQTERYVEAHKPSNSQANKIVSLSIQGLKFQNLINQGNVDPEKLEKYTTELQKVHNEMAKIAADLSTDKQLDIKFWQHKISNEAMNDFVINSVNTQGVSQEEIDSFRE